MSEAPSWMEELEKIAEQTAKQEGCYLYDIEFIGVGKGRVLRLFIDREQEGAISIEDCSNVSKALNVYLDANEDLIPGGTYTLEVSSPGLERHLVKPWHFQKAIGKKVYLKTTKALEVAGVEDKKWKSAKTVEDEIVSADEVGVSFEIDSVKFKIPYSMIERAKILFEFTKGQKK